MSSRIGDAAGSRFVAIDLWRRDSSRVSFEIAALGQHGSGSLSIRGPAESYFLWIGVGYLQEIGRAVLSAPFFTNRVLFTDHDGDELKLMPTDRPDVVEVQAVKRATATAPSRVASSVTVPRPELDDFGLMLIAAGIWLEELTAEPV